MEDNVSWLPHSNNCLCILKHLLNHICVTEALNRPLKPVSCLSAGLAAEPSTIPCYFIDQDICITGFINDTKHSSTNWLLLNLRGFQASWQIICWFCTDLKSGVHFTSAWLKNLDWIEKLWWDDQVSMLLKKVLKQHTLCDQPYSR